MQNDEQTEGRDEEKDRQNKPSTTQSSLAQDFRCGVCKQSMSKPRNNYGGISCDSCRIFFRRNVQRNLDPICLYSHNCVVDFKKRKSCASCRMRKCLSIGMDPGQILLDDAKERFLEQYNKTRNSQPVPTQNQNGNVLPFLYTHSSPYSVPLSVIKKNETLTSPEMDMSETASNSNNHTSRPSLLQTIQNDSEPIASIDYYGPTTSKVSFQSSTTSNLLQSSQFQINHKKSQELFARVPVITFSKKLSKGTLSENAFKDTIKKSDNYEQTNTELVPIEANNLTAVQFGSLKEKLQDDGPVHHFVKNIIYQHKKLRYKDSTKLFTDNCMFGSSHQHNQNDESSFFASTREENEGDETVKEELLNMLRDNTDTSADNFTNEEIMLALDQALKTDVRKLENILTFEEIKYLDLWNTNFWNSWKSYNLGEEIMMKLKQCREQGHIFSPYYNKMATKQMCARIISYSAEFPLEWSEDAEILIRENLFLCLSSITVWTNIFEKEVHDILQGFVDKKIVEDIQMESDFTIEEFYSNMTDLPIMLKNMILKCYRESRKLYLIKDLKVLSLLIPIIISQYRFDMKLKNVEKVKEIHEYSTTRLRRYFYHKYHSAERAKEAYNQTIQLISVSKQVMILTEPLINDNLP